jgi:hypothetical protein
MRSRVALAFSVGLALGLFAVFGGAAFAGHGSWTHHDLHVWDPSPSTYSSYADVDASQAYDFGHARWSRWNSSGSTLIEAETVTCQSSEGCGYRKTVTQSFGQSRYVLRSYACAKDGDHKLSGTFINYDPCSGLPTHIHSITTN